MTAIHVVVMGVAGCGKSAVGEYVARALSLPLIEGDEFHPPANIDKMRRGLPLDDQDRSGWLAQLAQELERHPGGAVLTCSALKRSYRDRLRPAARELRFVHLQITQDEALRRVQARDAHFYPPSLVASQFDALESPSDEPGVLQIDASESLEAVAGRAVDWLQQQGLSNSTMRN